MFYGLFPIYHFSFFFDFTFPNSENTDLPYWVSLRLVAKDIKLNPIPYKMSKAQDPFYIVKEEIQDSIDKLQSSFHQWERVPGGTGEQVHLTKELLANCESIAWQVDELDKAISVAARDPSWYGINEVELENRRRWTSNARLQVLVASLLSGRKKGARCITLKPAEKWMHATSEQLFSNREALCLLDNCGIADVVHLGSYILLKKEHIFSNGVLPWWGKGKGSILVGLKQEMETSRWREHEACGMCNGCPLRIILFDKVADVKRTVGAGKENDNSASAIRRELMRLPNSQQPDISDHYSAKSNDDFLASESDRQMLLLKQQDEELDELSTSVKRIGGVGLTIHEELLAQEKILDELGTEMDSTKNRLDFVQVIVLICN
ncbi:hypothetical protein Golax_011917 [Gossypium laxum]|uniref:t-SNARE coiled-coil homology domain-containing protein n=2 Tax=Gossypium laxum TaxID=34288 RepID=A0A7J8ZNC4_9ROSI|nr:hypothetical protein [Gossypium laxum]